MTSTHPRHLHFVVAGPLNQRTGGYLYDARMVTGLAETGWRTEVHELPGRWPEPSADARKVFDARLSNLPDGACVAIDGLVGGAAPRVLERHAARLTLVAIVHHPLTDEEGISARTAKRLTASESRSLAAVRGVIVTSAFTAERLRDFGVEPARTRVVEPGIPRRSEDTEAGNEDTGPRTDREPLLLCLGSVVPRKDQLTLIRALDEIRDLPWRCRIVGSLDRDPEYTAQVRRRVEDRGLTDRIELAGEVDDAELERTWARADVFVLPSRYEGYGMALTEAMIRGLPVVSTTGGAIPFTVPADVGRLVEPGDPVALAGELRRVIDDAGLRHRMADASRRHAAGLPGWSEQVARFARAVREFAGG